MKNCGLIILAAGSSSRLQQPKQLLPYNDTTLLQHSIDTALSTPVSSMMVVSGSPGSQVGISAADRLETVTNAEWKQGMGSSISYGVSTFLARHPNTESLILMVCDQPFVSAALLSSLMETAIASHKEIVACSYGHTIGTPVLFRKKYFRMLCALQGDEGAKKIVMQHMDDVASIPFPEGEIDIDTMHDYEKLLQKGRL